MSSSHHTRKVALITGSSSGIGRTSAVALSRAGWTVVLTGRRKAQLEETQSLLAPGVESLAVDGDLTKEEDVKRVFDAVVDKFGRLDLLFNNAGANAPGIPLEDLTPGQFRSVIDINLTAPFICTQYAFRIMKAQEPQGGRIINNGSISAYTPRPNSSPYTASKHAISGLTKASSLDGRKYNIAVSQLDIGNADTSMGGRMAGGVPQADGSIKPEPVFDVQYVADAVVYMAGLPLGVNILNQTILATNMPSWVGRG